MIFDVTSDTITNLILEKEGELLDELLHTDRRRSRSQRRSDINKSMMFLNRLEEAARERYLKV